ncbi:MAG: oxygenase, partial [Pseudonocardiales bacterium]
MDVLVAGAGPVGLMAAYELLRRGVSVRIVDAASGPATTSRAAAVHARTMEVLDQVGLYEAFAARAVHGKGIAFHADGQLLASMDARFTTHATRFDQVWFLDQVITEQLLRDAVTGLGGRIEWGVRLTGFDETDDRLDVTLEHADGHCEQVAVPWLIGADGGHSEVRRRLGITLQGDSSETWLIADADLDFVDPVSHDRIRWVRTDGATTMIFPLVGDRRWRLLDTADVNHD